MIQLAWRFLLFQKNSAWPSGIGPELRAQAKTVKLKEKWCEAEVNRIAGEIALISPAPDATKAEAYFERALAVARRIGVNRVAVRQINNTRHLAHHFQGYLRLQFRINLAFVHLVMVSSVQQRSSRSSN